MSSAEKASDVLLPKQGSGQDPLVGKRFGNCLLQRRIGAGAMGYVYLAHHVGLNKPVAIKIMSGELIGAAGNVQRFLREAQMAASLEHPNVVQVFDVGEANGLYYLAMQYVEGRSLDKHLEAKGKLPVAEANGMVKKIALALAAAHKIGIVHRDIKPANVLMSKDGQIKVADFGLAHSNDAGQSLSLTGQIVGTPYYMSPEQAQGTAVDARADLYSLGATWYHLLTGRRPFEGDTPISIILKHVNEAPVPPERLEPSIPPGVSQLILKLLAKKPEQRFASGEELVRAMVSIEAGASTGLAPGAEKILELGGESMLDLFAPPASEPGPSEKRILELGGESLLDLGHGPSKPAPKPPAEKRQTTVAISKDFKGKDSSVEGQMKEEGKPVIGKYLLLREIQKEADDLSIWEAENVRTKARVALRLLTGHDSDRIRAFYKLAADGTHLKHPNILHVLECHSDTDAKGRVTHFMAVELVSVLPLDAVVGARMLPPKQLVELCEQVARALDFAHQKQKTHLTLTPREVQVEPPSRAIISFHTFGPSQKDEAKAKAEALADAPYLAPEQVPGVEMSADAATDVYRLGAVLYWVATGRAPFEASNIADCYQKILSVEPKAPKEIDPKIDPELEKIILTAIQKEKELRYATAGELADALKAWVKRDQKAAPAAGTTRRVVKKTLKTRLQVLFKTHRRAVIGIGGTLAVLIALAVGVNAWHQTQTKRAIEGELGRARLEALNRYSEGKFEEALAAANRALGYFAADESMANLAKKCRRRILEAGVLRDVGLAEDAASKEEAGYLERLTRLEKSVKDLSGAIGSTPGADETSSIAAAGIGAFATGDVAGAVSMLEKAASLESRDPAAALTLARAYFARMVLADAVARFMGGPGERDPRSAQWQAKLVEAMERPTQPPREGSDVDLADLYTAVGRGELERVKALAVSLLRRAPPPGPTAEALALRAWATGGDDLSDLDASVKARPFQTTGYVLRASRHAERGAFASAVVDLTSAARPHPNQPIYTFLRAKARQGAGDPEGAMADVMRVKLQVGRGWEYQTQLELLERALPERLAPRK